MFNMSSIDNSLPYTLILYTFGTRPILKIGDITPHRDIKTKYYDIIYVSIP